MKYTIEPIIGIIAFGTMGIVIGFGFNVFAGVGAGMIVYGALGWRMNR
jgi:hypothetical protein